MMQFILDKDLKRLLFYLLVVGNLYTAETWKIHLRLLSLIVIELPTHFNSI